jgi:hypothetical protein
MVPPTFQVLSACKADTVIVALSTPFVEGTISAKSKCKPVNHARIREILEEKRERPAEQATILELASHRSVLNGYNLRPWRPQRRF